MGSHKAVTRDDAHPPGEISDYVDLAEGAAPATPASGKVRLYAKTDGSIASKDDAGTETEHGAGAGGGGLVDHDLVYYTAGDITVSATAIGTTLQAALDLTVAASEGDLIEVTMAYSVQTAASPGELRMDIATRVSSSDVTYLSTGTGTSAAGGIQGLDTRPMDSDVASVGDRHAGGSIPLVVGASDIDGGNVVLRFYGWKSGGDDIVINADSTRQMIVYVKNFGQ